MHIAEYVLNHRFGFGWHRLALLGTDTGAGYFEFCGRCPAVSGSSSSMDVPVAVGAILNLQ